MLQRSHPYRKEVLLSPSILNVQSLSEELRMLEGTTGATGEDAATPCGVLDSKGSVGEEAIFCILTSSGGPLAAGGGAALYMTGAGP